MDWKFLDILPDVAFSLDNSHELLIYRGFHALFCWWHETSDRTRVDSEYIGTKSGPDENQGVS